MSQMISASENGWHTLINQSINPQFAIGRTLCVKTDPRVGVCAYVFVCARLCMCWGW